MSAHETSTATAVSRAEGRKGAAEQHGHHNHHHPRRNDGGSSSSNSSCGSGSSGYDSGSESAGAEPSPASTPCGGGSGGGVVHRHKRAKGRRGSNSPNNPGVTPPRDRSNNHNTEEKAPSHHNGGGGPVVEDGLDIISGDAGSDRNDDGTPRHLFERVYKEQVGKPHCRAGKDSTNGGKKKKKHDDDDDSNDIDAEDEEEDEENDGSNSNSNSNSSNGGPHLMALANSSGGQSPTASITAATTSAPAWTATAATSLSPQPPVAAAAAPLVVAPEVSDSPLADGGDASFDRNANKSKSKSKKPTSQQQQGGEAACTTDAPDGSANSVGGHHLSLTRGRTFMKMSDSRREEDFYATVQPYQQLLVCRALARWDRVRRGANDNANSNSNSNDVDIDDDSNGGNSQEESKRCRALLDSINSSSSSSSSSNSTTVMSEADREAVESAVALWWREKDRDYDRGDETAFEVQRRHAAHALAVTTASASASASVSNATTTLTTTAVTATLTTPSVSMELLPPPAEYEESKARALRLLVPFVPRFLGLHRMPLVELVRLATGGIDTNTDNNSRDDCVGGDDDHDDEGAQDAGPISQLVCLEDVCHGFARPCVLDMKMGTRQYGMHPTPDKKKKKEYRCTISTSGQYGIRLAGLKWWNPASGGGGGRYESKGKRQCRSFTLAEVKEEMSAFVQSNRSLELLFSDQLQRLRIAFAQQNVFQLFTSSLLFVYDADQPLETARIVMVDFAFTYERRELAIGGDPDAAFGYDVGYLKALDTLLSLVA